MLKLIKLELEGFGCFKDKKEFLKSEKDVLKIFEIDYYLWNKGKQLRQNKS